MRISAADPSMVIMYEELQNFPYKLITEAMQGIKKIMQAAMLQHPEMLRSIWSRPEKVNQKYRTLTEMSFKSRSEMRKQIKKAKATLRSYEISRRVKKVTCDHRIVMSSIR